jgi:hypothetical protein
MIVKIQKAGGSFKGLTAYLTGDKERVAWTRSLNCANDDVPSIVHELYMTASQAELLKEQAGVHAGGSVVDKPVKHISLNWHPDERPTQDEMIMAAEAFLERMGWEEHQAFLVAHKDKEHLHVHIELNRIHPETGKVLNDAYERRRASDWALDYEREHGSIRCEDRLQNLEDRTREPSRRAWEQLRETEQGYLEDERASLERLNVMWFKRDDEQTLAGREWQLLKNHQRDEREEFFAQGKIMFRELRSEVYRDVREQFREDWGNYYAAARAGADRETLDNWKAGIIDLEAAAFDQAKTDAFQTLRSTRDLEYKELLGDQREDRHALHRTQAEGERSYELLNLVNHAPDATSSLEVGDPANQNEPSREADRHHGQESTDHADAAPGGFAPARDGIGGLGDVGVGLIGAVATLVERLFDSFLDGRPERIAKPPAPEPDPDARVRREALRMQQVEAAIEQARAERARERDDDYWRDRQRTRG